MNRRRFDNECFLVYRASIPSEYLNQSWVYQNILRIIQVLFVKHKRLQSKILSSMHTFLVPISLLLLCFFHHVVNANLADEESAFIVPGDTDEPMMDYISATDYESSSELTANAQSDCSSFKSQSSGKIRRGAVCKPRKPKLKVPPKNQASPSDNSAFDPKNPHFKFIPLSRDDERVCQPLQYAVCDSGNYYDRKWSEPDKAFSLTRCSRCKFSSPHQSLGFPFLYRLAILLAYQRPYSQLTR